MFGVRAEARRPLWNEFRFFSARTPFLEWIQILCYFTNIKSVFFKKNLNMDIILHELRLNKYIKH
jgi:hypothetical protein